MSRAPVRSFLLAAVIALGIAATWFVVLAWTGAMIQVSTIRQAESEQILVQLDGEPVILRRIGLSGVQQEVLSLEREPTSGDAYQVLYPSYLLSRNSIGYATPGRNWNTRLSAANDGGAPARYWYLIHDGQTNGRVYGVGYHSATKRIIGYFSRTGFSDHLPPRDTWFEVAGDVGLTWSTPTVANYEPYSTAETAMHLLADKKLWSIDLRERKVTPLADIPDPEAIGWAWRTSDKLPDPQDEPMMNRSTAWAPRSLFIRTSEACLIVNPDTGRLKRYPLPESLRKASLAGFELADGRLLLVGYSQPITEGQFAVWVAPETGKVTRKDIQLVQNAQSLDERTMMAIMTLAGPLPIAQCFMVFMQAAYHLKTGAADSYWSAVGQAIAISWPGMLLVWAISAALAVAAYRRQKRFGLPYAVGWAIFAFLFGVPGWIAYRWHRTWPPVEDCPACDQPAPRDREACTECGADFPPPPLKGTEVFA